MIKIDLIVIGNLGMTILKLQALERLVQFRDIWIDAPFQHNYLPTLGLNLVKKEFQIKEQQIKLCIWDTAGQDKYFSLTKSNPIHRLGYFQRADGVVMVFDIADRDSFGRIGDYWLKQVQECSKSNAQSILVGNKLDLCELNFLKPRNYHRSTIYPILKSGLIIYQGSAKTGEGVQEAFNHLSKKCAECVETEINDVQHLQIEQDPKPKPWDGCVNVIKVQNVIFQSIWKK